MPLEICYFYMKYELRFHELPILLNVMCLYAQKLSFLDIKWRCHQTTSAYDGQNLGSLNFM